MRGVEKWGHNWKEMWGKEGFVREEMLERVCLLMPVHQQGGAVMLQEGTGVLAEDGPQAGMSSIQHTGLDQCQEPTEKAGELGFFFFFGGGTGSESVGN